MKRISSFNPDRILWCCEDNNLTVEELAVRLRIPSLPEAVKNGPPLTVPQLQRIARFFDRGILFFMDPAPVNEKRVHTPQFRTINSQKSEISLEVKSVIRRAEAQRQVYLTLLEEQREPIPAVWDGHSFAVDKADIKATAARVRSWLGLEEGESTFSFFRESIEKKGALVFLTNGYKGQWQIPKSDPTRAISLYYEQCPLIIIKKQESPAAQSFSLMHELGHLLLHKTSVIDHESDLSSYIGQEKDANAFAGNVLVPDHFLKQLGTDGISSLPVEEYDAHLREDARRWGVSVEVVLRRLLDEGLLHNYAYRAYREYKKQQTPEEKSGGSRAYRSNEPLHIFGRAFVETVLESLGQQHITLYKASTFLDNLKISDLRKLEEKVVSL